jgi:serine/threonine protein kinase
VLGAGANGIAFLGRDSLDRPVTVKVWPPRLQPSRSLERAQEQAVAEAKKISQLKHESIGMVYQVGRLANGWPFTISEYMSGEPLARVRHELNLPVRRLVVLSVLSALTYAESREVLHGDLHDRNVVYDGEAWRDLPLRSGSAPSPVRLIDFGTSAFAGREASDQRHARLLRAFVFDLWPELREWLRPMPSLDQLTGFNMLPILDRAASFVLLVQKDREPGPQIKISGIHASPRQPTSPAILGTLLARLTDFDVNHILMRLAETYSSEDLQQCRAHLLLSLLGFPEGGLRGSQLELDRALDNQLRSRGQQLDERWLTAGDSA